MTMDRALCAICAWRGDCYRKFMRGDGIYCPDYTKDLTIKARADEGEPGKPVANEKTGKGMKGLFKW